MAQRAEVIVFGGAQFTSANYKVTEIKQPAESRFGYMGGVAMKVDFDHQLYFYPSVYYSLKGYKVQLNNPSFPPTELAINNTTTIHTIEVSPMFHFDFSKKSSHPFIRVGPAVDFAFSGTESFDTLATAGGTGRVKRPMVFSFGDYGRFSASANFHLGYETSQFVLFGFYNLGFGSMNNADYGPTILHRIGGLAFGWKFNRGEGKAP
jgi:hypothetical protein